MNLLKFKKVASSANDANIAYLVNPDKIKGVVTGSTITNLYLAAVDGTDNNTVGDMIRITHSAGDGEAIVDKFLEYAYGNMSNGGVPITVDANFYAGITDIIKVAA
jgi:hypothetical protein